MTRPGLAVPCAMAVLATGAITTAQALRGSRPPTGVLVGVHRRETPLSGPVAPPSASLRTLWFEATRTSVEVVPALLIPRRSGFWRAELDHFCTEEPDDTLDGTSLGDSVEVEDTVRAYPIEAGGPGMVRARSGECQSTNVRCTIDRRIALEWVWPESVLINRPLESGCGAHPDGGNDYGLYRLENLDTPLSVAEALGPASETRFRGAFARAKAEYAAIFGKDCSDEAVFDPKSLHIWHKGGDWRVEGWSLTGRSCAYGFGYTAPIDLRPVVGGVARPRSSWRRVAGVTDAVASPDGQWVLLIFEAGVALSPSRALERPVARAPLTLHDDRIVMVEWATGTSVARWRNEVGRQAAR